MLKFDLHSHTVYSDGTLRPAELVQRAHAEGVNVLAITDHDITDGLDEARRMAEQVDLKLVNGVEISVTWSNQTIHVVALNIDPKNEALQTGLRRIREERAVRAKRIADKLEKAGVSGAFEAVKILAGTEAATRTHFARFLVDHGHVDNMHQAFKKFLGKKGKAFVGGHWVSLEEAVSWIVGAGGQAVIAHPVRYKMTRTKLCLLIEEFKQWGGTGIEISTASQATHERKQVAEIALKYDLLASVGSDFHSPGNPRVELGRYLDLPKSVTPIWHDWDLKSIYLPLAANGGMQ